MRRHLSTIGILLLAACGGSTETELGSGSNNAGNAGTAGATAGSAGAGGSTAGSGGSTAGKGGSSTGGSSTGGSSTGGSSTGGSGGSSAGGAEPGGAGGSSAGGAEPGGSGGSAAGSGGSTAGTGGSTGACDPPADPTKAAVCVTFAPEQLDLVPDDPQLDGQGLMLLAAYDTPFPDNGPGEADDVPALATVIYPTPQGANTELKSVYELPTLRLDGLPATVYLRALFFDNTEALEQKKIAWGVWLGGLELAGGLKGEIPLNKQALSPGKGTALNMALSALRRLEVTVKLKEGTKPLDNGAGPFQWFSFNAETIQQNMPIFGLSDDGNCLSLADGQPLVIRGLVVGPGDHYVVGNLNDYNNQGDLEGGEILNIEATADGIKAAAGAKTTVGLKDYKKTHAIDLSLVVPFGPDQPAPPSYSCP